MGVRIVMPLRVLLPGLAVCLAAAGAAAIGLAAASTAGGVVMRQADEAVRACASSMLDHGLVVVPGTSGPVAVPGSGLARGPAGSGICGIELVSARGQVLIPAASAAGAPAIPASGSWMAAHLARPITVPGTAGGDRWRVVITAVHYQAQRMLFVYGPDDLRYVISRRAGHGSSGMLIVTAGLAGTGQVAADDAAAAGIVLVLLAAAAFAVTRTILRPLRAAAGLTADAGPGAGGPPGEVLARVPANGPLGGYAMMLASIRERLQASRAAEAAARRSAADMSGHLAETCLQLRRPVSIVHGFAEYLRQQDKPRPASLDRMLHRVAGEVNRMETLAQGLRMPAGCCHKCRAATVELVRSGSGVMESRMGAVMMATDDSQQAPFTADSALTKEEVEQRNLEVVAAHFHNENPDDVDKAIALYAPDICWEAPNRGVVYTDAQQVKDAYMGIFRTLAFRKITNLRRFAAGNSVFDDLIAEVDVVGNEMPNMPFPVGTTMNVRLVHCFELRDGQITREIAYEMWREKGGALDHDAIPAGAGVTQFPAPGALLRATPDGDTRTVH